MYKPNIAVVGPSGSGKSTSLQNLPDEQTVVLDTELKGFPFRKKFSTVLPCLTQQEFFENLRKAKDMKNKPYIAIDSYTKHLENCMAFCRGTYKGYDIFSNYNGLIRQFVNAIKTTDKTFIIYAIDEFVDILSPEGTKTSARRIAVQGKEWEGKLEKEFTICLFTDVRRDAAAQGKMKYSFLTNTDGICSAKSPAGMFPELLIPNDIYKCVQAMEGYYK